MKGKGEQKNQAHQYGNPLLFENGDVVGGIANFDHDFGIRGLESLGRKRGATKNDKGHRSKLEDPRRHSPQSTICFIIRYSLQFYPWVSQSMHKQFSVIHFIIIHELHL